MLLKNGIFSIKYTSYSVIGTKNCEALTGTMKEESTEIIFYKSTKPLTLISEIKAEAINEFNIDNLEVENSKVFHFFPSQILV